MPTPRATLKLHPRVRAEGVILARRGERLRTVAERDAEGWVIGFGHRASARDGARVTEDDATALLVYDLSRSAGRLERLLHRPISPELFDALNVCALHAPPGALAGSALLTRINAGEAVSPAEALAARHAPAAAPPSAVLAAADAVRARVSRVLDAPEAPPAERRGLRELTLGSAPPWELAPEPPHPSRTEDEPSLAGTAPPSPSAWRTVGASASEPDAGPDPARADAAAPAMGGLEPEPPPLLDAPPQAAPAGAPAAPAASPCGGPVVAPVRPRDAGPPEDELRLEERPTARPSPISFERGGRARTWERIRNNPYVYLAVGICGLALFVCALAGVLLESPRPQGLLLGLAGLLCLAPCVAFFLQRRGRGRPPGQ